MNQIPQHLSPVDPEPIAPQDFLNLGLEPLAEFAGQVKLLDAALVALGRVAGEAGEAAAPSVAPSVVPSVVQSVAHLREDLAQFEPAITVLGQVKSGKTTLVNALAGWSDLLPADVNPWTSVVTSLHLMPGPHRREVGARFQLMKEDEWDRLLTKGGRLGELAERAESSSELDQIRQQIEAMREKSRRRLGKKFELLLGQVHEYGYFDRNLLERYVCLGDDFLSDTEAEEPGKQGWFADITRSADLYLHCRNLPYQLCLRDTPGVNDTFLMREQVTIGAVRHSRVCVVVLSAQQALTSTDLGLIRLISNLQSRDVIIFVNRIDELADPGRQVAEIEAAIRDTLARHQGPAKAEIIFGSAYWANKVLSEEIEDISDASAAALLNWAEVAIEGSQTECPPNELVWQLSGLPRLNRAIARHSVTSLGTAHLRKVASAALTLAGGLQAAATVRVTSAGSGTAGQTLPDPAEVTRDFAGLIDQHLAGLAAELDQITRGFQERIDRAHVSFLERATHSLVKHLEDNGEGEVWQYDPAGLRMVLKAAYSVYATRAQTAALARYKAAVQDVAGLLYASFGEAVEGIELALPEAPEPPAPVSLAQTIALDFKDGWWRSWWRRTRGYKAFSDRFYAMIAAETQDFLGQFKTLTPQDFNAQLRGVLATFLDQSRAIAAEIGQSHVGKDDLKGPVLTAQERTRRAAIETLIAGLRAQVETQRHDGGQT
jgi:signal recognition particle receptor subunit beta